MKNIYILFLLLPFLSFAQTTQWHPTQIFLKVAPEYAANIATFQKGETMPSYPLALERAFQGHAVYALQPAFQTRSRELDRIYQLSFTNPQQLNQLIRELKQLPEIEYAEKIPLYYPDFTPNDYNSTQQWHLNTIQAPQAWDFSQGSADVVIAVVDNAVDIQHPDLVDNIWTNPNEIPNNNIDDDGNGWIDDVHGYDVGDMDADPMPANVSMNHGTHVAGCASATSNNGIGVASIGFGCSIMAVKSTPDATWDGAILGHAGLDYAISSGYADIINMSYGGTISSRAVRELLNEGNARGIMLVASAGNGGGNILSYPGAYEVVFNVGATNSNDKITSFSNYGTHIDVMSPGQNIRSTVPGNAYASFDGTSMAGPIVAGLAGLMKSLNPCLTNDDLKTFIRATCNNIDTENPNFVGLMGAGRINARLALQSVQINTVPSTDFLVVNPVSCDGNVELQYLGQQISACPTTIVWDPGNGESLQGTHVVAHYDTPGTYTINLLLNNTTGTVTANQTVNIQILPQPQLDAGDDMAVCYGEEIVLEANSDVSGAFTWYANSGFPVFAGDQLPLTVKESRAYFLRFISDDGCTVRDTVRVDVLPSPQTYAGEDVEISAGGNVQLEAMGADSYEWHPPTALSCTNCANPIASPSVTRQYVVKGMSAEGCEIEDELIVYVTGTTDVENELAVIGEIYAPYPNPVEEMLELKADFVKPQQLEIQLLDMQGRVVEVLWKARVEAGTFHQSYRLPAHLSEGIYMLKWQLKAGSKHYLIRY